MTFVLSQGIQTFSLVFPNEEMWHYEVRFGTDGNADEATLLLANATQNLLQNEEIIGFYNRIKNLTPESITNAQIYNNQNELVFDASRLEFEYLMSKLEFISSNESLTRPGVGILFLFKFYNAYVGEHPSNTEEEGNDD